jgi:hypothetical protein
MLGANAVSDWAQVAVTVLLGLLTAYIGLSIRQKRRQEIAVSVSENRFAACADLWSKIPVSPELMDLTKAPPLTDKDLRDLFNRMTVWYYSGGHGMLPSTPTRQIYLTIKTNLICDWRKFVPVSQQTGIRGNTAARSKIVIRQLSLLRTAMRADLALLVPAFMRLMGEWNWWMPSWTHTLLRVRREKPSAEIAAEAA